MVVQINYFAVLGGAFASMVLGSLWYGPVFGKVWTNLAGLTSKDMERAKAKGMGKTYFFAFVVALVMSYITGIFVDLTQTAGITAALVLGIELWLGYVATVLTGMVLWEGKPVKLYLINAAYYMLLIPLITVIHAALL